MILSVFFSFIALTGSFFIMDLEFVFKLRQKHFPPASPIIITYELCLTSYPGVGLLKLQISSLFVFLNFRELLKM